MLKRNANCFNLLNTFKLFHNYIKYNHLVMVVENISFRRFKFVSVNKLINHMSTSFCTLSNFCFRKYVL